ISTPKAAPSVARWTCASTKPGNSSMAFPPWGAHIAASFPATLASAATTVKRTPLSPPQQREAGTGGEQREQDERSAKAAGKPGREAEERRPHDGTGEGEGDGRCAHGGNLFGRDTAHRFRDRDAAPSRGRKTEEHGNRRNREKPCPRLQQGRRRRCCGHRE